MHAAVIAINEAIENQVADDTYAALSNAQAHLVNLCTDLQQDYQNTLYDAKQNKSDIAKNKVRKQAALLVYRLFTTIVRVKF